jgi:hypothetical protein
LTEKKPDATIKCYATITAIRSPNIVEVKSLGNTLIMNFVLSANGVQIGNFVTPYNPTCEIGDVFGIDLTLTKINKKQFLEGHGFQEVTDNMKGFIV